MTVRPNFETDGMDISSGSHGISKRATEARQGVALGHVRFVLGFSLALVVVAFAIVYLIYS